jgi:probable addiction module antidote protein
MPSRSHDDAVVESFHHDPEYALELLNSVLEDADSGELLITLRQFTRAFGGVQTVADKAQLNPTQLYRTLSAEGNPTLNSLRAVLKAMGLQLAVQPIANPIASPIQARKRVNPAVQSPTRPRKKPAPARLPPASKAPAAKTPASKTTAAR